MPTLIDPNKICVGCMQPLKKELGVCPHCGVNNATYRNTVEQLPVRSVVNGKYLVGRTLGQGGFGITYIGWELNLDMKLAIKEYYPGNCVARQSIGSTIVAPLSGEAGDFFERGKERFLSEARTLAKLDELSGIVDVRDFFTENNTAYLVMDYVDGKDLKSVIQSRSKLPAEEALQLLKPLILDLARVHERGMIHRDISPDNIRVRPDGTAVLIDFGAARAYMGDQPISAYSMSVKNGYAPPEQYQNGAQGPFTDVYAMCATIYNAVTGQLPTPSLERLTLNTPLQNPAGLAPGLSQARAKALMDGMALQTDKRVPDMKTLYDRLYADSETGGGKTGDKAGGGRSKLLLWVAALLIVANLGVLAFQLISGAPDPAGTTAPTATETPLVTASDWVAYNPAAPLNFAGNAAAEEAVRAACKRPTGDVMPGDAARVASLDLSGTQLVDANFLNAFTGLRSLDVSDNRLADLAPVASMPELRTLDASGNLLADLSPLASLANLTQLLLHDNRIADLRPLASLTALESLDVSLNRVADASPLASLTALQSLWIHDNALTTLDGLQALTSLTMLSAGNNRIADVSPVASLPALTAAYLYQNQITDASALVARADLKLDVAGNPCASQQ